MTMRYSLVSDGDLRVLTIVHEGTPHICDNEHPYFEEILDGVLHDDPSVLDLMDMAKAAHDRFLVVTERVTVEGGNVYFDGDLIDNALTQAIVRAMNEGSDFLPLALFMEKVYQNPNRHSRENLYTWLADHEFSIDADGDLVCYKGVRSDLTSTHAGPGIVNGVPTDGHLDNSVGNVIEMPRSQVQHDPSQSCSVGLHVAHWDYASNWDTVTVKVKVNPRDVVSVPTDSNLEKMRVCRYQVVGIVDQPVRTLVDAESDWDNWAEEEEGAVW